MATLGKEGMAGTLQLEVEINQKYDTKTQKAEWLAVKTDGRVGLVEARMEAMEQTFSIRFQRTEGRLRAMDEMFNRIDERFQRIEGGLQSMENKLDTIIQTLQDTGGNNKSREPHFELRKDGISVNPGPPQNFAPALFGVLAWITIVYACHTAFFYEWVPRRDKGWERQDAQSKAGGGGVGAHEGARIGEAVA